MSSPELEAGLSELRTQAHGAAMCATRIETQIGCLSSGKGVVPLEKDLRGNRQDVEMMVARYSEMLGTIDRLLPAEPEEDTASA